MTTPLPPLQLLYATNYFGHKKFEGTVDIGSDCPIPDGYHVDYSEVTAPSWCTITSDMERREEAAGLIFHAVDAEGGFHLEKIRRQPWILDTMESPFVTGSRTNPVHMKMYDYLASYHLKSSFLMTYFSPELMDIANRVLPKDFIKTKTKAAPILWIASNCIATNDRHHYIKELMRYVEVHSYGPCLNNIPFAADHTREGLMSQYKFYLAIENSNCEDYVTEKLVDTITGSTVPIIDGPISYKGFLPNDRSAIRMDAYPDPRDLADYINYLHNNDTAYLEYFAYRRDALTVAAKDRLDPTFISRWSDSIEFNSKSSWCSICRGMVPWWLARVNNKYYEEPNKKIFKVDNTCGKRNKWEYAQHGPPYRPFWTPTPKDEFTRPTVPTIEEIEVQIAYTEDHRALIANISFVFIYALFILFLWRQSKKSNYIKKAETSTVA